MEKHIVFVYGTLRKHERNHHLLREATQIASQAWTTGEMFDTGLRYPVVVKTEKAKIYGELYEVTEETLALLDQLEGYVGVQGENYYDRIKTNVQTDFSDYKALLYVAPESSQMAVTHIASGDWKVYQLQNKTHCNIQYFAYGSCMDMERIRIAGQEASFQQVLGKGILNGFSLKFTHESYDGGRADIVENGGIVEGKVYDLPPEALSYLYSREGVNSGCYRPAFVDVVVKGKVLEDVLTFVVVNKREEITPPYHYVEEIFRGGKGVVSERYLNQLQQQLNVKFGMTFEKEGCEE